MYRGGRIWRSNRNEFCDLGVVFSRAPQYLIEAVIRNPASPTLPRMIPDEELGLDTSFDGHQLGASTKAGRAHSQP